MMRHITTIFVAFYMFMLLDATCEAFVSPVRRQQMIISSSSSSLNLLPNQGNQLVAAFNAATSNSKNDDDDATVSSMAATEKDDVSNQQQQHSTTTNKVSPSTATRSFAARLFHLPSAMKWRSATTAKEEDHVHHQHHHEWISGLPHFPRPSRSTEVDEVLYPIVGFQFVQDDKLYILPTTSHVACSLSSRRCTNEEEVYGWFSPSCQLNMYSEDPCEDPATVNSSNNNKTP